MPEPAPPRCLVVDDDEAMRVLVRLQLEAVGAVVVAAADAQEARRLIDTESPPFRMVVADHRMPGRDSGVDVLRHAQDHHQGTALVLLSSHVHPDTLAVANALGAMMVDKTDTDGVARHWTALSGQQ